MSEKRYLSDRSVGFNIKQEETQKNTDQKNEDSDTEKSDQNKKDESSSAEDNVDNEEKVDDQNLEKVAF